MAISDRIATNVRRFAVERIKTFKPDPAKFARALAKAEQAGDTYVIKNLALAAEKYASHGENAALGAQARKVFHDGAAKRVEGLVAKGASFENAVAYKAHLARLEETVVAHQQMLVAPKAGALAATTAKNEAHAAAYPALEAVMGDLARAKKTFEGSLASARQDLAQAQAALRSGQSGAQGWVDRATTSLQKLELELMERTKKPTAWVAAEQARYDEKLVPLAAKLATATGEVAKVEAPIGVLGQAFKAMETVIGGAKAMWWKLRQGFDPSAAAAARTRLGL